MAKTKKTPPLWGGVLMPGGDLLSQSLSEPVSSALGRFTAVCGMGTGGTAPLWPPVPKLERSPKNDEEENFKSAALAVLPTA